MRPDLPKLKGKVFLRRNFDGGYVAVDAHPKIIIETEDKKEKRRERAIIHNRPAQDERPD